MFGDLASISAGLNEALSGGELEVLGVALDLTGEGAVVGIPLNAIGGAMVIHGGAVSGLGAVHLMEGIKGGGKTGGKVSKDALKSGQEKVARLRKDLKEMNSKPNKVPADKVAIERKRSELKRAEDQLRRSEEHARVGQH
jgi:hypothetical protein